MSCDFDVFCLDCNANLGLQDWNRRSNEVQALIANAPAIAALAPLARSGFTLEHFDRNVPIEFFAKHLGHRLLPRDEYGGFLDECGAQFACLGACGNHWLTCRLVRDHEGQHLPKRSP